MLVAQAFGLSAERDTAASTEKKQEDQRQNLRIACASEISGNTDSKIGTSSRKPLYFSPAPHLGISKIRKPAMYKHYKYINKFSVDEIISPPIHACPHVNNGKINVSCDVNTCDL